MAQRLNLNNFYLARVVNNMAPYFQLTTPRQISETIALQRVVGLTNYLPNDTLRPPSEVTQLVDLITNTSVGALPTNATQDGNNGLLQRLSTLLEGGTRGNAIDPNAHGSNSGNGTTSISSRLNQLFTIYYASSDSTQIRNLEEIAFPYVRTMLGSSVVSTQNNQDNTQPWRRCSLLKVNTPYLSPANKYTEAISVYMNGIPSIEFSRAVPYVDIKFISARNPTDLDNRLNSMTIFKLLEGAVRIDQGSATSNAVRQGLVAANSPSGSINGFTNTSGHLSETGMELFSTPQTMINANTNHEGDSSSLRAVPVIDPYRSFLSFKTLTIDLASSGIGMFSFKTGKLDFVLHDRSRLSEIADFIKPDLYGTTDIMIEYGWMHPDPPSADNLYADLLNASRTKEKFMIRNVSFVFSENGEVNITLDIAMRGASDFSSEVIATANEPANNTIRRIRELSDAVNQYRSQVFRTHSGNNQNTGNNQTSREIRGIQVLDSASDFQNNIRLDNDFLQNLSSFRTDLGRVSNSSGNRRFTANSQAAQALQGSLDALVRQRTNTSPVEGAVPQLSRTLRDDIHEKLASILSGHGPEDDPFLPANMQTAGRNGQLVSALRPRASRATQGQATGTATFSIPTVTGDFRDRERFVSLAKLLLHFVALPLARTDKFDDVQLIFYPFNECAGFANHYNIGQFIVDTNYFFEQYVRLRTENLSRAASINLRDFMGFITGILLDDPGAAMYGIDDLYTSVRNRQTGATQLQPTGNTVEFQTNLENRLRDRTPNGEFRMPQIQFYVEALPLRRDEDGTPQEPDSSKTILRIHIFDRQASHYQTQGAILAANRNETLNSIAAMPNGQQDGEEGIRASREQQYASVLNLALGENLIQNISNGPRPVYVVNGGPHAIKNFVMRTMPYIIYGAQNTAIKSAQLSSQQNAELSTVNMLRSFRSGPLRANGEQPGGIPLSIIPCELSVASLGCNLLEFGQQFFIDFQTGTTADNIYGINGVTHKLGPGTFETETKFVPLDAYGRYSSFIERIRQASDHISVASSIARQQNP